MEIRNEYNLFSQYLTFLPNWQILINVSISDPHLSKLEILNHANMWTEFGKVSLNLAAFGHNFVGKIVALSSAMHSLSFRRIRSSILQTIL